MVAFSLKRAALQWRQVQSTSFFRDHVVADGEHKALGQNIWYPLDVLNSCSLKKKERKVLWRMLSLNPSVCSNTAGIKLWAWLRLIGYFYLTSCVTILFYLRTSKLVLAKLNHFKLFQHTWLLELNPLFWGVVACSYLPQSFDLCTSQPCGRRHNTLHCCAWVWTSFFHFLKKGKKRPRHKDSWAFPVSVNHQPAAT